VGAPCHEHIAFSIAMLAGGGTMTDFPFALLGFDLDGTLVDSAPDIAAAVNHSLATIGRPPLTVDWVRSMMGGGARLLLQRALRATGDEAPLDELLPELLDYNAANIAVLTRPFPGVLAALDDLRDRGVVLAVVTNKLEHLAIALLRELGLADRFACVIGGDTDGLVAMKPDRAPLDMMVDRCAVPGRPAFVGDTTYDVRAARAAGMPVALFSPGHAGDLGADIAFAHYDDLAGALEQIAGAAQPVI